MRHLINVISDNHFQLVIPMDFTALIIDISRAYKRGPYGANEAMQRASQAAEGSLQQILLDQSQTVWYAFYSARKELERERTFDGKGELKTFLQTLEEQSSVEDRRAFAAELARKLENQDDLIRPAKRGRT